MIPRSPATFENPMTDPAKVESISREIGFAGSELPLGESIKIKRSEVKSPVKNSAAPMVPRKSVGLRNLRHSARMTRIISYLLSFQRRSLPDWEAAAITGLREFQPQKLFY